MAARVPAERKRPRRYSGSKDVELAIFAATESLLAEHRLNELSVARIIAVAGISRKTFYQHFSSKYEVVAAVLEGIFEHIYDETHLDLEAIGHDPEEAIRASVRLGLDTWFEHRWLIQAAMENQHTVPALADAWPALRRRFLLIFAEQVRAEREAGRAPAGLSGHAIATVMVSGAERIFYVLSTGSDPDLETREQGTDAVTAVAVAAIYGAPIPSSARSPQTPTPVSVDSTQDAIVWALKRLLEKQTLDEVRIEQLLTESEVSRGTFYFYFESKEHAFAVLLEHVMSTTVVPGFEAIVGDRERRRTELGADVTTWLRLGDPDRTVVRRAIEEWPRHAAIRDSYLAGRRHLVQALKRAIDEDREDGVAPAGMSSAQLASGWMWTMERSWYDAVRSAEQPGDFNAITAALGATLVAAVYGTNVHR